MRRSPPTGDERATRCETARGRIRGRGPHQQRIPAEHPQPRPDFRHRPGRHRQDLSRGRLRRRGAASTSACAASCWCAPRWKRASASASCPATGAEGRSVPAADVRRALRDARLRPRRAPDRAQHDRGRAARLHARPHAERVVHHPRRGAEHDRRADEDVPDPHRLRLARGRDRRHHADRPAGRHAVGPAARAGGAARRAGHSFTLFRRTKDVVRHPLVQRIVEAYEAAAPDGHGKAK